jgi:NAD(P)-dependent dehydrogenase (short-subunit alcohol dehydrogenase family)
MQTKIAIITGGARGIGLGISRALAAEEYHLVIAGVRSADEVTEPMRELNSLAHAVHYCQADISLSGDRRKLIDETKATFGRLDLLVNNAGVAPSVRADILDAGEESFDRLISINLKGPYFLTQLAAKMMIEQKRAEPDFRGKLVNVSSVSATVVSTNRGDYCISKAGVAMATQLWAARLAEFGIDVYEIRPGVIATDMTAGVKEKYDALFASGLTLEQRWGQPADVGKAVAMLARGELTYATGQVLTIDGGLTQRRL